MHTIYLYDEQPCSCGAYFSEGRPPSHPGMAAVQRELFHIGSGMSPDEWAARYSHQVGAWSGANHSYADEDPEVESWVAELLAILGEPGFHRLRRARTDYLTPEERAEIEREIGEMIESSTGL